MSKYHDYLFRYLAAILKANDGSIMKTVVNKHLIKICVVFVSGVFGPSAVMTINSPIIPKAIDAYINICVAIFCISSL